MLWSSNGGGYTSGAQLSSELSEREDGSTGDDMGGVRETRQCFTSPWTRESDACAPNGWDMDGEW